MFTEFYYFSLLFSIFIVTGAAAIVANAIAVACFSHFASRLFLFAVTTFVVSGIVGHGHKLDMVHIQNSTLAGGVAVGSVCNMLIGPHGALLIGSISAIICVLGYRYLTVGEIFIYKPELLVYFMFMLFVMHAYASVSLYVCHDHGREELRRFDKNVATSNEITQ